MLASISLNQWAEKTSISEEDAYKKLKEGSLLFYWDGTEWRIPLWIFSNDTLALSQSEEDFIIKTIYWARMRWGSILPLIEQMNRMQKGFDSTPITWYRTGKWDVFDQWMEAHD